MVIGFVKGIFRMNIMHRLYISIGFSFFVIHLFGKVGIDLETGFYIYPTISFKNINEKYHPAPTYDHDTFEKMVINLVATKQKSLDSTLVIMSDEAAQKLDIPFLIKQLNTTSTITGSLALKQLIHPLINQEKIQERTLQLKTLLNNQTWYATINKACSLVNAIEQEIIRFYDPQDTLSYNVDPMYFSSFFNLSDHCDKVPWLKKIKDAYFPQALNLANHCNNSATILNIEKIFDYLKIIAPFGLMTSISAIAEEHRVLATTQGQGWGPAWLNVSYVKNLITMPVIACFMANNPFLHAFKNGYYEPTDLATNTTGYSLGDGILYDQNHFGYSPLIATMSKIFVQVASNVFLAYLVYQSIDGAGYEEKTLTMLHQRLYALGTLSKQVHTLLDCAQHENITCNNYCNINYQELWQTDSEKANVLRDLEALPDTFEKMGSLGKGTLLALYKRVTPYLPLFTQFLEFIGNLDAYHAIANFYQDSVAHNRPICFVNLINGQYPYGAFDHFVSPVLFAHDTAPMTNTLTIGSNPYKTSNQTDAYGVVLTGPSFCGKTTYMKSITHQIILAQSFGIATADSCTMVPFTHIMTSIDVTQNLEQNLSGFLARQQRLDEILGAINHLEDGQKMLTIIDEPLGGALIECEASRRVYELGKNVTGKRHNITFIATHFELPIKLEQTTNGFFVNYHPEVLEYADGTFTITYQVLPGSATWWFNDQDKSARFIDWLGNVQAKQA
jgi:hypothetical protein